MDDDNRLKRWKQTKSKATVNNPWIKIHKKNYELPNGKTLDDFYVVEERPGVNVVAITSDKKLLLVRQYRAAVNDIVYDFPAGFVEDDGKPLLEQAKRELLEETGYTSSEWYDLGKQYPAPHRLRKQDNSFLAVNVKKTHEQNLDETEFLKYELIDLEKLKKMIVDGDFTCGVCLTTLLKATLKLEKLSLAT